MDETERSEEKKCFYNCKIKLYPDGTKKYTVFNRLVYNPHHLDFYRKSNNRYYIEYKEWLKGLDAFKDTKKNKEKENQLTLFDEEIRTDSVKRAKEKIFDIALCNDWNYFITLTLDCEKVDRYNKADINKKLKKWLNNQVNRKDLHYLIIPEYHKDGAIHFHGLIDNALSVEDSKTYSVPSCSKPVSLRKLKSLNLTADSECVKPVYNLPSWSFGFSSAVELTGDSSVVSRYITKYITKDGKKIMGKFYYAGGHGLVREVPCEYKIIDYDSDLFKFCKEYEVPNTEYKVKYLVL